MKKSKLITIAAFILFTFVLSGYESNNSKNTDDSWSESIFNSLTLEEKVGQLVFPGIMGNYYSEDNAHYIRIKNLVTEYKVGGLIFFQSEIMQQVVTTNKLQRLAKIPLLISADFERGVAQRVADATLFPYNMAIGAADDTLLTYNMGRIVAKEGLAMGVHQNYAPVIDLNNNPYNPIINVRAYGEDRELVSRLGEAFMRGLQDEGMIATAKHFPGHGNTNRDSHLELPLIEGTKEELYNNELYPFNKLIKNGVQSVMITHLAIPALEPDIKLPSSLSYNIITKLLKEEMKFDGLIVTDALNMKAITNSFSDAQSSVMAIKAGNDCILYPSNPEECITAIINAVRNGEISEERINYSVKKILKLKEKMGLNKRVLVDEDKVSEIVGSEKHWDLARKLARKSITLLKDEKKLIPLSTNSKIKYSHIIVTDNKRGDGGDYFNRLLLERINLPEEPIKLTIRSTAKDFKDALDSAKKSDIILLSVYMKVRAYQGSIGINKNQKSFIDELIKLKKPLVLMSHGNPYFIMAFQSAGTYLTNYGDPEVSEEALCEAIFGEINIEGKLPISIPNTKYAFKSGLNIEKSSLLNESNKNIFCDEIKFRKVDELINKAIKDTSFPGAVLLVAKDGTIIHHKAYGHLTYDATARTVELNTIYDLASVTKVIATTTATMICIDRGLFKLDDPVKKYIPQFANNNKDQILIKNLLLHNSGLPAFKQYYKLVKNEKELLEDIYNTKLDYPTGTKTVYSDLGLITLGKIIEKVTKKSLDQFTRDEIFIPLGMNNTFYKPDKKLINQIAPTEIDNYWRKRLLIGEVHDENAAMLGGVAGHAGLFSTAEDLAKLLQMLLQKGFYQGRQYIKKETVELFIKQQSPESSRALGWDTNKDGESSAGKLFSTISYGHTGYTGTSVWTDPTKNLIVVFLTNRVHPTRNNTKIISFRPILHSEIVRCLNR